MPLIVKRAVAFTVGQAVLLAAGVAFSLDLSYGFIGFGALLLMVSATSPTQFALIDLRVPVVLSIAALLGPIAALASAVAAVSSTALATDEWRWRDQMVLVLVGCIAALAVHWAAGSVLLVLLAVTGLLAEVIRQGRQLLEQNRVLMLASAVSVILLAIALHASMSEWSIFIVAMAVFVMHHSMRLYSEVQNAYETTIYATADAIEAGVSGKSGHSRRVADLAGRVGHALHLSHQELLFLRRLSLLHELGIGVGEGVLNREYVAPSDRSIACFADVLPVLAMIHGKIHFPDEQMGRLAYIVCRASNIDDAISGIDSQENWYNDSDFSRFLPTAEQRTVDQAFREALV